MAGRHAGAGPASRGLAADGQCKLLQVRGKKNSSKCGHISTQQVHNSHIMCFVLSASVLDRLNALLEPGGSLTINERGVIDGKTPKVTPHPNFR